MFSCFADLADKEKGTLYKDATRSLLAIFINNHQYFFIAYDYDNNYIFAKPIGNVTDTTIVDSFNKIFTELNNKGYTQIFNVTDN